MDATFLKLIISLFARFLFNFCCEVFAKKIILFRCQAGTAGAVRYVRRAEGDVPEDGRERWRIHLFRRVARLLPRPDLQACRLGTSWVHSIVVLKSVFIPCRRSLYNHRVGRVLSFFSSRWNWDSPNPSPPGKCAPPRFGGMGTLAGERRVGRVPIPTRGHTLWYSLWLQSKKIWIISCLFCFYTGELPANKLVFLCQSNKFSKINHI